MQQPDAANPELLGMSLNLLEDDHASMKALTTGSACGIHTGRHQDCRSALKRKSLQYRQNLPRRRGEKS
jgi:hypothetical protein